MNKVGYYKNNCRLCKSSNLIKFLDLGLQPPSDQFIKFEKTREHKIFYPLEVNNCRVCGFKQLSYVVNKKILYQDNYPYESSLTATGAKHFGQFAKSVTQEYKLCSDDLVIDIGSNVGILLNGFKKLGIKTLGIDPAKNICKIANKRGIKTINYFFDTKTAKMCKKKYGTAKVLTGTNVFAHIDDLDNFFNSVCELMDKKKGILIIEVPYFVNLFKKIEYDTIYHEHLSYITILPLIKYLTKFKLEIINVLSKDIHGGSIRIFISNAGNYKINKTVNKLIIKEKKLKLNNLKVLENFSKKVKINRYKLIEYLTKLKIKNKKIIALSAPAKGMTLLNYCKIDNDYLDYTTEKSKLKIGSYTPGGQVPVYSDAKILKERPDFAILLAWNFSKEIINNNKSYLKKGGKFIIPIPKLKIISKKKYNENY
jgi:2-polyprenyl-3-methyl-5-hydroxy-6-metoxy-1,4-benzoquinol methylase